MSLFGQGNVSCSNNTVKKSGEKIMPKEDSVNRDEYEILKKIKKQRWYFIDNKEDVIFDKKTGYLWANLDKFDYNKKNGDVNFRKDGNEISIDLNIHKCKGWTIPTMNDFESILDDGTFYFMEGENSRINNKRHWLISGNKQYKVIDLSTLKGCNVKNACLLPCNKTFTSKEYIKVNKSAISNEKKAKNTLLFLLENRFTPNFRCGKTNAIYEKMLKDSIKKKPLVNELNKQTGSILSKDNKSIGNEHLNKHKNSLENKKVEFIYEDILNEFRNITNIDSSLVIYYKTVKKFSNLLLSQIDSFENSKRTTISSVNNISSDFNNTYSFCNIVSEKEKKIFIDRENFFNNKFIIKISDLRKRVIRLKTQAEQIEERIYMATYEDESMYELAIIESEKRVAFTTLLDVYLEIVRDTFDKVNYIEDNKVLIINIINLEKQWQRAYELFKSKSIENFKIICEDNGIGKQTIDKWINDWIDLRTKIEMKLLPLIEMAIKKSITEENFNEITSSLNAFKEEIDKFYIEERINIHQKFAFEVGGDLQEKLETENQIYKINLKLEDGLQDIIFSLKTMEQKINILNWSHSITKIPVEEVIGFIKSNEVNIISENILKEFSELKEKNYQEFLFDIESYTKERKLRDKEYNSLMFKMRKELIK